MDTDSQEFKNYVKMQNLSTRTNLENHKDKQEIFKKLMPLFAGLSIVEKEDLMHTLENRENKWTYLEDLVTKKMEKKLAGLQEREAYLAKSRYKLDLETMQYADKNRMPVDKKKLKNVLRQRSKVFDSIMSEVPNYEEHRKVGDIRQNTLVISGILDRAIGGQKDLFNEVGLKPNQLAYKGPDQIQSEIDGYIEDDKDWNYQNFLNGVFMEMDMTDYQDTKVLNKFYEGGQKDWVIHPASW